MNVLPSNCDCEKCSSMCKAPCCGTPEDMQKLINHGYASRLMLDDWPGGPDMLKPALKGSEGLSAPWEVSTEQGCTFWKNGKCELHDLGLKPIQGKLAHHNNSLEKCEEIEYLINNSWKTDESETVVENWKIQNPNWEEDE